jgi:hypothetical protein
VPNGDFLTVDGANAEVDITYTHEVSGPSRKTVKEQGRTGGTRIDLLARGVLAPMRRSRLCEESAIGGGEGTAFERGGGRQEVGQERKGCRCHRRVEEKNVKGETCGSKTT